MTDFGLKIPYCCCFDLRIGGLVIGYLQLILIVWAFLSDIFHGLTFASFLVHALFLGVFGSWVYGIHTDKTMFMIPSLIVEIILYVLSLTLMVVIPIVFLVMGAKMSELIPDKQQADSVASLSTGLAFIFFILYALASALQWLFTAVKYSLYKQMKEADQSNASPIPVPKDHRFNVSA